MLVLVLCLLLIFNSCWSIGFSAKLTFVFLFEPLHLHLDPKTHAKHMDVIFLLFASTLYQGSCCYSPLMSLPPPHISINGILFLPLVVTSQLGKVQLGKCLLCMASDHFSCHCCKSLNFFLCTPLFFSIIITVGGYKI